MQLYPRLVGARARELVKGHREGSIAEVHAAGLALFESFVRADAIAGVGIEYTETGGARARHDTLAEVREALLSIATEHGYAPEGESKQLSTDEARVIDALWAVCLHERMQISRDEAGRAGVWAFLGCVLLPGLVRWRFARTGIPPANRFTGSLQRNTFYRLWWRAELLRDPEHVEPYWLLSALGEDEQVQFVERPSLAGCRALVLPAARLFIELVRPRDDIGNQMKVMRELTKRMLRLLGIVAFELLTPLQCTAMARGLIDDTLEGMNIAETADPLAELSRPAWMSKLFSTMGLTTLAQVAELNMKAAAQAKGVGRLRLRQLGPVVESARHLLTERASASPQPSTAVEAVVPAEKSGVDRADALRFSSRCASAPAPCARGRRPRRLAGCASRRRGSAAQSKDPAGTETFAPATTDVEPERVESARFSGAEAELLAKWAHLELMDYAALREHSKGAERRLVRQVFGEYDRFFESLAAWRARER